MPNAHFPNNLIQNITMILSKEFEDRPWADIILFMMSLIKN